MVVDIVEQPQPQILYDVQQEIPQHEPVQPNVNLEQEMLVDIVQQPEILEHVQQEMVVDIVEQPQPQILYDVQQEIPQHEPVQPNVNADQQNSYNNLEQEMLVDIVQQ